PILVAATVVMFATGIAAALVGHGGLLLGLHKTSFIVWGIAFGVHVLGHVGILVPVQATHATRFIRPRCAPGRVR
ncbi:MAG: hypothetical protein JWO17_1218, partial [Actinomycetia bacterium]|nr:hypothetical protein [Actinomycetes bacterium]